MLKHVNLFFMLPDHFLDLNKQKNTCNSCIFASLQVLVSFINLLFSVILIGSLLL